jgi:hypothetical protein
MPKAKVDNIVLLSGLDLNQLAHSIPINWFDLGWVGGLHGFDSTLATANYNPTTKKNETLS